MRETQRPTVTHEKSNCGGTETKFHHPSYAVIRVSNPHGRRVLFGSDVEHNDFIELEIAPATLKRNLNTDWIHGDSTPIVTVAMTHAQFVSMIQSSGKGSGTPCTLQYAPVDRNRKCDGVPLIEPIESKSEMIKSEIERDAIKAVEMATLAIRKAREQLDTLKGKKTALTKKDLSLIEPLLTVASSKVSLLPGNLKFALDCAEETIDQSVHDAKIEIEAAVEHKLRNIGLEAVNNEMPIDVRKLLLDVKTDRMDK